MKNPPATGYVLDRKTHLVAVYLDGHYCGSTKWETDAHDWLEDQIVQRYGAGDHRRYGLRRTLRTLKAAVTYHNWRAAREGAEGSFTREELIGLLSTFGGRCLWCHSIHPGVDHVVPLKLGGPNFIDNLQPLCLSCNTRKMQDTRDFRDPHVLVAFLASLQR